MCSTVIVAKTEPFIANFLCDLRLPAIGDVDQVGGLITADGYKLLLGNLNYAGWTGPEFPNRSSHNASRDLDRDHVSCGNTSGTGCLYQIFGPDEAEHLNLAASQPEVWERMMARLLAINKSEWDWHSVPVTQRPTTVNASALALSTLVSTPDAVGLRGSFLCAGPGEEGPCSVRDGHRSLRRLVGSLG